MGLDNEKGQSMVTIQPRRTNSDESTAPSLKSPRTARFAEATSVNSPVDPIKSPFDQPLKTSEYYVPQAQPSDVGFGYIGDRQSQNSNHLSVNMPITPRSPLKSALRSPGAAPRSIRQNPLSPTWLEEEKLEEEEEKTEKQQAKDLKVKIRVRMAKMALRGTNFSCSLIVLSMLSTTFQIFNETSAIPPRNSLPPWALGTKKWPQIVLLAISCVSLFMSLVVFYGYYRGGHKRAEKVAVYYSLYAVGFFTLSIIMWGVGAGILQNSKANGKGQDMWGWSCKDNARKTIFASDVSYDLVCRLQNWSLVCCLIEVIVEVITISIYAVVFYRYYSKRRLRKSMAKRDTARSDLYLAQLRSQSAPNTPGIASPRDGGYNPMFSPRFVGMAEKNTDELSTAEEGDANVRYVSATPPSSQKPFTLQTPPLKKVTPKLAQGGFERPVPAIFTTGTADGAEPSPAQLSPWSPAKIEEPEPVHHETGGSSKYEAVPIPGAYASPINSPGPTEQHFQSLH